MCPIPPLPLQMRQPPRPFTMFPSGDAVLFTVMRSSSRRASHYLLKGTDDSRNANQLVAPTV
eukprot:8642124-Pyramimonas_sp.AAC.1